MFCSAVQLECSAVPCTAALCVVLCAALCVVLCAVLCVVLCVVASRDNK
jgi:hypothetical protein